jgi:hypothetical protein
MQNAQLSCNALTARTALLLADLLSDLLMHRMQSVKLLELECRQ